MFIRKILFIFALLLAIILSSCGKEFKPESDLSKAPLKSNASIVEGDIILEPVYKERITNRSGNITINKKGLNFDLVYDSTFYGHDSAINRDFVQYCRNFKVSLNSQYAPNVDRFFLGSFNGNLFFDIVYYKEGKIHIQEDMGEVFFPDETNVFDIGNGSNFFGTGFYDDDDLTDLLFVADNGIICVFYSEDGSFIKKAFTSDINPKKSKVFSCDIDGDSLYDILVLEDDKAISYINTGDGFKKEGHKDIYLLPNKVLDYAIADMNCDSFTDIVCIYKDKDKINIRTLFGRGNGNFGPKKDEKNSRYYKNLFGEYVADDISELSSIATGDVTGDRIPDIVIASKNGKKNVQLSFLLSTDEPAYDYSMHVMKMDEGYIMYSGCRWFDLNTTSVKNGDGDHVIFHWSDDGINWKRRIEGPMFLLGWEEGKKDWWTDNTLEPEVVFVDGEYHMLWQCTFVTPKGNYGDKIGYAHSKDGINWDRKIDEPVIVNVQNDEIGFNHQELIYVKDDIDNKPWHLYVGHFVNNQFSGHVRIRSSVPYSFDWQEREGTSGLGQIGNQIGYLYDDNGDKLYMRITFNTLKDEDGERTVPTFNISRDGLVWHSDGSLQLAAVDVTDPITSNNRNVYFLGMSTINGTGEIEKTEDGLYKIVYVATCANEPGGMPVFAAEGGVGVMTFRLNLNG